MKLLATSMLALLVTACAATPTPPATQIKVVREVVEVPRGCRVTVPQRPSPLSRPLPTDAEKLAAVLGSKLNEWSGPGMFGDRALGALAECVGD